MKLKFLKYYSDEVKKGHVAIIDRILFDKEYIGGVKVRVINIWKKPRYLTLAWFVKNTGK